MPSTEEKVDADDLSVRKYTIAELRLSHFREEMGSYKVAFTNLLRLNSYIHNPRAEDEDVVVYLLVHDGQLIAYRTLLPDNLYISDKQVHIAWFSGNYVVPEYRRKGYSSRLLKEVEKDWKGRLLFSNYAMPSKYVLDQNEQYALLEKLEGRRFYFQFGLTQLLPPKAYIFKRSKGVLAGADRILNALSRPFLPVIRHQHYWEKIDYPDEKDWNFIDEFRDNELFKRGKDEFEWILNYPWIGTDHQAQTQQISYHFSLYAESFDLSFYRLREKGITIGIVMLSIRDKVMHVPYSYLDPKAVRPACHWMLSLAAQKSILHLTLYQNKLVNEMNNYQRNFLFSKSFRQAYLCSKELLIKYPEIKYKDLQKGDGDAVFT